MCYVYQQELYADDLENYIQDANYIHFQYKCNGPLGSQTCSRDLLPIPDEFFDSSTSDDVNHGEAFRAKFTKYEENSVNGAFRPQTIDKKQWLQITFQNITRVTSYQILGGKQEYDSTLINHYLLHSYDCKIFQFYLNERTSQPLVILKNFNKLIRMYLLNYCR